jgi:ACS family hexuronate transporter-like MFS transporter
MRIAVSRLRWIILILLGLSTVINYIDRQALAVLLPILRKDLGLTGASYGTIATAFLLAYTIAQFIWGFLIDRWGPRRGFTLSVLIWSLAAMAHAWCLGPIGFGLCRILLGMGEAGNWPAGGKAIATWFPRERRAFAMGFFDGGSGIGAILAPPLLAFLTLRYGWRMAFLGTGILGLIWLVAWLLVYYPVVAHPLLSADQRQRVKTELAKEEALEAESGQLLIWSRLWALMSTRMLATPVWWFYVFWLPDYLTRERHFTLADIGLFGWIPYVTVDLGKLLGGSVSDRLLSRGWPAVSARKTVMAGGAFAMMAGLLVTRAATSLGSLSWISLATFGFGLWSANILALHADLFPSRQIGKALGFTGMAASLGGAASSYLIGRIVDFGGYQPVFYVAGFAAIAAFGFLYFGVPKTLAQPAALPAPL